MPLAPDTRLGRYEIRSHLGAGGMGDVYLARDTQLGRSVALKILPPEVSDDPERMRRFQQEARAAAALNHPNIAHVYEIGVEGGTHFIAMEHVEGETLREKIHRGQTPLGTLLKHLVQVAEGLAKAHAAGVVHRDLKPDNVMVARDGYAKILDFGLAKLVEAREQASGGSASDVATALLPQHSLPGTVMGTVGYMSPEQALGKVGEIDHRSDIFSFGCVLFEAVTGRRPFQGTDPLDSLHKIVHEPTPQLRDVNAAAPEELQRVVRRCLAKDPEKRYQSIKDVAIELEEVLEQWRGEAGREDFTPSAPGGGSSASAGADAQTSQRAVPQSAASTAEVEAARPTTSAEYLVNGIRRHKLGAVLALAALVVAGVGFALYRYAGREPTAAPPIFQNVSVSRLTTSGRALEANISPDGKFVVYLEMGDDGMRGLYVKQTATGNTINIVPPTRGNILKGTSFSPDGNFVYYLFNDRTKRNALYQVSSVGGTPKRVIEVCDSIAALSPDGRKIAFMRFEGPSKTTIFVANADGTGERALVSLDGDEWFSEAGPAWSPDGKTLAIAAGVTTDGVNGMRLLGVDAQTGATRELSPKRWVEASRVVWIPDAAALVLIATERADEVAAQVWRVAHPSGEAARVTNDVQGRDLTSLGVTADGRTLVTVTEQLLSRIETIPAGGDMSRPARLTTAEANREGFYGLAFAPDGGVVFSSFEGGQFDLWVMNADGSGRQRLTSDTHLDGYPAVSPDGRHVVFLSNRPDGASATHLWRMDIDGGNLIQLAARADFPPHVSPDGRWVAYGYWSGQEKRQSLWKVSIEGGEPVRLTDYSATYPSFSPDGQWIGCFFLDEQVTPSRWLYGVIPASGGRPVRQFDFPGYQYQWVRWTPDGRHLSHIGAPPDPSNIWLQPAAGGEPRRLTDFKTDYIYRHAWSRDGKTLALARGRHTFDVVLTRDNR